MSDLTYSIQAVESRKDEEGGYTVLRLDEDGERRPKFYDQTGVFWFDKKEAEFDPFPTIREASEFIRKQKARTS